MRIGIPTEIKTNEYRVGMTPAGVKELVVHGHEVTVQAGAGLGAGHCDDEYRNHGARVVTDAAAVYEASELVVKVKEPQPQEYAYLRSDLTVFTYLHLAANRDLTEAMLSSQVTGIAYETVTDSAGRLPLLAPMSEVAGRMAVQAGAWCLEKAHGGSGILLGGVPGVAPARVVVLGGGVVGTQAVTMAVGAGSQVTVLDKSLARLRELDSLFGGRVVTLYASQANIEGAVIDADLLIGAVLVPGAAAPRLVGRELIRRMRPGSVLVDVAIDQGGCFEPSRPTTHAEPVFMDEGKVFYCVANIPGAVPKTSAQALGNATLPYVLELANHGVQYCLEQSQPLRAGLNIRLGNVYCPGVAQAFGLPLANHETTP